MSNNIEKRLEALEQASDNEQKIVFCTPEECPQGKNVIRFDPEDKDL
jgi:hypothetical protein